MEKEFIRVHHYAVSRTGVLAHIKDAHNDLEDYYCPYCGCKMLKKCGNIRVWHFAHDCRDNNELQKRCSYETYLHEYAKLRIKQWFEESGSIILHWFNSIVCKQYNTCRLVQTENCYRRSKKSFDIKRIFNNCWLESPVK